jgi:hypothetical protein
MIWSVFCIIFGFGVGHAVAQLVEALRYKPGGRGFDSRWFSLEVLLT